MMIIRSAQAWADSASGAGLSEAPSNPDPLQAHAAQVFADDLAACRVPSVRAIRGQFHVGQPRAQRLRDYLAAASGRHDENLAASGR